MAEDDEYMCPDCKRKVVILIRTISSPYTFAALMYTSVFSLFLLFPFFIFSLFCCCCCCFFQIHFFAFFFSQEVLKAQSEEGGEFGLSKKKAKEEEDHDSEYDSEMEIEEDEEDDEEIDGVEYDYDGNIIEADGLMYGIDDEVKEELRLAKRRGETVTAAEVRARIVRERLAQVGGQEECVCMCWRRPISTRKRFAPPYLYTSDQCGEWRKVCRPPSTFFFCFL